MNQKGFGVVEVLIVVIFVALLGFVGYRAYVTYTLEQDTEQKTEKRPEAAEKESEIEPEEETTNIPDGWKKYSNTNYGFSFAHPSEWGNVEISTFQKHGHDFYDLSFSANNSIGLKGYELKSPYLGSGDPKCCSKGFIQESGKYFTLDENGQKSGEVQGFAGANVELVETQDAGAIFQSVPANIETNNLYFAIINSGSEKYPGFAITGEVEGVSESDFRTFISTFKKL